MENSDIDLLLDGFFEKDGQNQAGAVEGATTIERLIELVVSNGLNNKFRKLAVERAKKIADTEEDAIALCRLADSSQMRLYGQLDDLRQHIEVRIGNLLRAVCRESLPEWFAEFLRNPHKIPENYLAAFRKKAEDMRAEKPAGPAAAKRIYER